MKEDRHIRQGDLWPPLQYKVAYDSEWLDITETVGASTPCTFDIINARTGVKKVDGGSGSVIVSGAAVICSYDWQAGDTDTPGSYYVLIHLTVEGKTGTAPTRGKLTLVIE